MSAVAHALFGLGLDARQAGLVREALALRPYCDVHALIARLDAWDPDQGPFALAHGELALVVHALAQLPYRRVHALIGTLERQLAALRAR